MKQVVALALVAILGRMVQGKEFTKCELKELLQLHTDVKIGTMEKTVCGVKMGSNYESSTKTTAMVDGEEWTLYGIFQLSHHYCGGGPDACVSDCSKFTDGNIEDDIHCMDQIRTSFLASPTEPSSVLAKIFQRLFRPQCPGVLSQCD